MKIFEQPNFKKLTRSQRGKVKKKRKLFLNSWFFKILMRIMLILARIAKVYYDLNE
jgi:hypothetical protein